VRRSEEWKMDADTDDNAYVPAHIIKADGSSGERLREKHVHHHFRKD